ncbi:hypothetical protein CLAIMM_00562 [Cladophialophora immunda]|nr:hypothetical protein CLAIMM_00562 [Cladophialophora immunda]
MDTGADLSLMTLAAAKVLGYEPSDRNSGTVLTGMEGHKAISLGTVQIPFKLRCDSKERSSEFHVVHDLAGHKALLGVQLIMELDHLPRPPCQKCEDAVLSSASPRPV